MPDNKAEIRVGRSRVKYAGVDLGFTLGDIVFTYTPEFEMFTADQETGPCKVFMVNEGVKVTVPLSQTGAESLAKAKAFAAGEMKAEPESGGGSTTTDTALSPGDAALSVASETTFADGDNVLVGSGPTAEIVKIGVPDVGTLPIDASTPLQHAHASGVAVVELESPLKTRFAVGGSFESPTGVLDIVPEDSADPNTTRVYKAFASGEVEFTYVKGEATVVEVEFTGLSDSTREKGDRLASIGNVTV